MAQNFKLNFLVKLIFIPIIIIISNCTENFNTVVKNTTDEEETLEILKALS